MWKIKGVKVCDEQKNTPLAMMSRTPLFIAVIAESLLSVEGYLGRVALDERQFGFGGKRQ